MPIDVKLETLVQFPDARSAFPGDRRVSIATLHRWRQRGVRGITGASLTARAMTDAVRRVLATHAVMAETAAPLAP